MGIVGKELAALMRDMWNNFFERKVRETQVGMIRYYRAEVTAAAQNGRLTAQKPSDDTELNVSYVTTMETDAEGRQVVVLVYGEEKNLANHMVTMYTDGTTANLYPNG